MDGGYSEGITSKGLKPFEGFRCIDDFLDKV
jgi:hypothetical protein